MNAGFNAATDIFSLGDAFAVKGANLNKSCSTAECKNYLGDVTHRDQHSERIAPTAEYELLEEITEIDFLGKVIEIGGKTVAIESVSVNTAVGSAPTISVTGKQIEDGGTAKRTYECPAVKVTPRHRAQDITGDLGETTPATLTSASFTFSVDITTAENKGEISASDCSNGRYEASYTHTVGDGSEVTAPAVSGSKVVSAPVSKNMPENGYVEYTYAINGTLTGEEATAA